MKSQTLRERFRETTSNAILAAAEAVAAKEGLANTSLQAIADAAGVAVGTIYNYFGDRQELFDELFARRREELFEAVDGAAKAHARARFDEQLSSFVRAVLEHFDARRPFLRIALEAERVRPLVTDGDDGRGRERPAMQQLLERAERVVRVGVRERRLRAEAAELAAVLLVSFVRGLLIARLDDPAPFASQADRVVSLFLDGVAK
jgi:AcrR family transcriptional regulator